MDSYNPQAKTMKTRFIFSWTHFIEAFRPASTLMMLQGVVFWWAGTSDQLVDWGQGSVVIGLLFWAGWALAKQLGVGKDRSMRDAGF